MSAHEPPAAGVLYLLRGAVLEPTDIVEPADQVVEPAQGVPAVMVPDLLDTLARQADSAAAAIEAGTGQAKTAYDLHHSTLRDGHLRRAAALGALADAAAPGASRPDAAGRGTEIADLIAVARREADADYQRLRQQLRRSAQTRAVADGAVAATLAELVAELEELAADLRRASSRRSSSNQRPQGAS